MLEVESTVAGAERDCMSDRLYPERTALMKFQRIECKKIAAHKSGRQFRDVDKEFAAKLARSIEREGMYEPIVVMGHPTRFDHFIVVQGLHRLYAKKEILKERVIECVVLPMMDGAGQELTLVAGELWRHPLTRGKQTLAIKQWFDQFSLANPTLVGRKASGYARARKASSAKPFASADQADGEKMGAADVLAAVAGMSKRKAERYLRIARALNEKQIAVLDEIEATNGDRERIAALDRLERSKVFDLIASGMDARGALGKVQKGKPSTAARKAGV